MQTAIAAPEPEEVVIAGDNSYRKYIELDCEGEFNTIQTIVMREDEWLQLIGEEQNGWN